MGATCFLFVYKHEFESESGGCGEFGSKNQPWAKALFES